MIPQLENYYLNQEEPNRGCLLVLREIILNHDEEVSETVKYGMPCFCYKKKMFCYLWIEKKTNQPYILMVEGKHLNHPKLEAGNRSRMKQFKIDAHADIPIETIKLLLTDALNLYRNGTIKIK